MSDGLSRLFGPIAWRTTPIAGVDRRDRHHDANRDDGSHNRCHDPTPEQTKASLRSDTLPANEITRCSGCPAARTNDQSTARFVTPRFDSGVQVAAGVSIQAPHIDARTDLRDDPDHSSPRKYDTSIDKLSQRGVAREIDHCGRLSGDGLSFC